MTAPTTNEALETTLLRSGFQHRIVAPNVEAGFEHFARLSGGTLSEADFHSAIADFQDRGLIRDPIRLLEGTLQCHWHFELTPAGIEAARRTIDSTRSKGRRSGYSMHFRESGNPG